MCVLLVCVCADPPRSQCKRKLVTGLHTFERHWRCAGCVHCEVPWKGVLVSCSACLLLMSKKEMFEHQFEAVDFAKDCADQGLICVDPPLLNEAVRRELDVRQCSARSRRYALAQLLAEGMAARLSLEVVLGDRPSSLHECEYPSSPTVSLPIPIPIRMSMHDSTLQVSPVSNRVPRIALILQGGASPAQPTASAGSAPSSMPDRPELPGSLLTQAVLSVPSELRAAKARTKMPIGSVTGSLVFSGEDAMMLGHAGFEE